MGSTFVVLMTRKINIKKRKFPKLILKREYCNFIYSCAIRVSKVILIKTLSGHSSGRSEIYINYYCLNYLLKLPLIFVTRKVLYWNIVPGILVEDLSIVIRFNNNNNESHLLVKQYFIERNNMKNYFLG